MENRFNLYSTMKNKNDYPSGNLPDFNETEIKDLIMNDLNLNNLISVKSKYSFVEFNNILLYAAYFVQTSFQDCIFQKVDFTKSNLNETSFTSCVFISCSFARAEIIGAHVINCTFKECNFNSIIFSENTISNTQFEITDQSYAVINDNTETDVTWVFE
ncbi:hypothetical protein DRF65_10395 [Chryseobacterium pennae]|uniref:SV2A/B/C luminal domain-containing protein n=1 Tax=Chryseobacterium pennae TaxID=2258962 RepID=A0A3D9C9D7_9FLAO|nr:pentapeptide repeat-containing protein [Chryseobacterium pennae]REC62493.1 hypothetical protein DRF65_10395 [Chryseobacterium pennae]